MRIALYMAQISSSRALISGQIVQIRWAMLYLGRAKLKYQAKTILSAKHLTRFYLHRSIRICSLFRDLHVRYGSLCKDGKSRSAKKRLADELPAQLSELGLRPRAMSKPSFTVRTLTKDDEEKALKFLRRFFFRDEPMNQAMNLLETADSRCPELEEYSAGSISQGHSVVAVDDNGEFVGLIINGLVDRADVDYSDKSESCPNLKFRQILKVLGHLDREAKIWEKLPKSCQKVMEVRIASTDSSWRGRGLMRVLCEEAERIAKAQGACAMRMDTTSAYSAAAAQRLGYKAVYEVAYADLPYAPQPPAPHLVAKVYIKEL